MAAHIWHYRFLCDDAYIMFRYARNFARGWGLVFNRGEYVEGYTSLLWTIQLAGGEWLGLNSEVTAPVLDVLYTVAAAGIWALFIRRQRLPHRPVVLLLVLLLLATHRSWAVWSTSGLEERCFTFFVLATFYALLRASQAEASPVRVRWLGATSLLLEYLERRHVNAFPIAAMRQPLPQGRIDTRYPTPHGGRRAHLGDSCLPRRVTERQFVGRRLDPGEFRAHAERAGPTRPHRWIRSVNEAHEAPKIRLHPAPPPLPEVATEEGTPTGPRRARHSRYPSFRADP